MNNEINFPFLLPDDKQTEITFSVVKLGEHEYDDPKWGRVIGAGLCLQIKIGDICGTISGRDAHRLAKLIGRDSEWWESEK